MDFRDTPEQAEYRAKTRAWLAEHCPVPSPRTGLQYGGPQDEDTEPEKTQQRHREWKRLLYDAGYTLQSWPTEWGGGGISPIYDAILNEEATAVGAPGLRGMYLERVVMMAGTPEQREKFVLPTMRGDLNWCQGFSEPSGGSDLPRGPHGECVFEDVIVPVANRIGEPGAGWRLAMQALAYERGPGDIGVMPGYTAELRILEEVADERGLAGDPTTREQLAWAYVLGEVLNYDSLKQLSLRVSGRMPGPEGSVGKLLWSSTVQAIELLGMPRGR